MGNMLNTIFEKQNQSTDSNQSEPFFRVIIVVLEKN